MKQNRRLALAIFLVVLAISVSSTVFAVPVEGQRMLVAGPSPYSAEITRDVIKRGGNVVDAAVAVALGLAVTTPYYGALGGGGLALVKVGDLPVEALDFRETAPSNSNENLYRDKAKNASVDGGLAVGIPGVPAGLWALHKKYGKLKWSSLFQIPLKIAREGMLVSGEWSSITRNEANRFNKSGKEILFKSDGKPYLPGDKLKQPGLARALELLSQRGPSGFYEGTVANDIVTTVKSTGGVISTQDLKNYKVRWLKPLVTEYRGNTIYLMPPPSSGGMVIKSALRLMDMIKLHEKPALSADELHAIGEILKISFRGRSLLGDPDFIKNPIDALTSDTYLKPLAGKIRQHSSVRLDPLKEAPVVESKTAGETTHFSVLDSNGNAVAFTVTLNGNYGSAVVTEKFGIALNNEMDDFTTRPGEPNQFGLVQGPANNIAPGKRPLSSMSPTLVEKNGRIFMSVGSPGGPRIISAVLQVLHRVLDNDMNIDQAIQAPRVHHQYLPDVLYIDKQRLPPETIENLRKREHPIEESPIAKVYGVRINADGRLEAAFDSRGEGGAGGL